MITQEVTRLDSKKLIASGYFVVSSQLTDPDRLVPGGVGSQAANYFEQILGGLQKSVDATVLTGDLCHEDFCRHWGTVEFIQSITVCAPVLHWGRSPASINSRNCVNVSGKSIAWRILFIQSPETQGDQKPRT